MPLLNLSKIGEELDEPTLLLLDFGPQISDGQP